jgi:hypothetical protein
MIRAVTTARDGHKILILGIDAENFRRLTAQDPIFVFGKPLGVPIDVAFVHGSDSDMVAQQLARMGLVIPADALKLPFRAVIHGEQDIQSKLIVGLNDEGAQELKSDKGGLLIQGKTYKLETDVYMLYGDSLQDVVKQLHENGIDLPVGVLN